MSPVVWEFPRGTMTSKPRFALYLLSVHAKARRRMPQRSEALPAPAPPEGVRVGGKIPRRKPSMPYFGALRVGKVLLLSTYNEYM